MSNKTQLSNNNTKLASLIQELQGKAAGGGSGSAEIKSGELTVEISRSSPGYYDYKLTADGFTPTKYNILIIYANETNDNGATVNALLAVVWGELKFGDYDKGFQLSNTIIAPKDITIMPDYVVLVETGANTLTSFTRNSIHYYAI